MCGILFYSPKSLFLKITQHNKYFFSRTWLSALGKLMAVKKMKIYWCAFISSAQGGEVPRHPTWNLSNSMMPSILLADEIDGYYIWKSRDGLSLCMPRVGHINTAKEKNPWRSLTINIINLPIFLIIKNILLKKNALFRDGSSHRSSFLEIQII